MSHSAASPRLDARVACLRETLTSLLEGDFDAVAGFGKLADDSFGQIEELVSWLALDVKTMTVANHEKAVSVELQHEALAVRRQELERQHERLRVQERELCEKADTIARQAAAIHELSTPILELWSNVLVLPLIGVVDTGRGEQVMTTALDAIARRQARWMIIDITGVDAVDTHAASLVVGLVNAARLLGTACVLTGVQPAVAQTLIGLGVDLRDLVTRRNLERGLVYCLRAMRRSA